MNSKSVCRFPMQEQKCHCHNGKFTCKNTIEIATDAETGTRKELQEYELHLRQGSGKKQREVFSKAV